MTFFRDFLAHFHLLNPWANYLAWGLAGLTFVLGLIVAWRRRHGRTLIALAVAAIIDFIAGFAFEIWPNPYPGEVPLHLFVAAFPVLFLAVGAAIMSKRRLFLAALLVFSMVGLLLVINLEYRQYPTLAAFLPDTNVKKMTYQQFLAQKKAPQVQGRTVGAQVTVSLPGPVSGFKPRSAIAYVPPAYWTKPQQKLPVIVMIPGSPGRPAAWYESGRVHDTADAYQREHDGVSPLLVAVDATGSLFAQPGCVDSPKGKVQTYLATDVPQLIKQHFRVDPNQKKWTLAGLSYGGTCTMQTIANSPSSYGTFLDFSGQAHPVIKNLKNTIKELFHGDEVAFRKVNAADVLKRAIAEKSPKYQGIAGKFITGDADESGCQAQKMLAPLARKAGMEVTADTIPGGHNYEVWRQAMRESFDFAATRGGLS